MAFTLSFAGAAMPAGEMLTTLDREGHQLRDLPAGDYLLVAIDDAESAGWQEPFRLDRWRPKAMRVTLLEGDAKVIELRKQSGR